MKKLIVIMIIILASSLVLSTDVFRFSGTISDVEEETASEFCLKQPIKECRNADYLSNEGRKPRDCRLVNDFDYDGYNSCREDKGWFSCFKENRKRICIERGAQ